MKWKLDARGVKWVNENALVIEFEQWVGELQPLETVNSCMSKYRKF